MNSLFTQSSISRQFLQCSVLLQL